MVKYCKVCNTILPTLWKGKVCMNCKRHSKESPIITVTIDMILIIAGIIFMVIAFIAISYFTLKLLIYSL